MTSVNKCDGLEWDFVWKSIAIKESWQCQGCRALISINTIVSRTGVDSAILKDLQERDLITAENKIKIISY